MHRMTQLALIFVFFIASFLFVIPVGRADAAMSESEWRDYRRILQLQICVNKLHSNLNDRAGFKWMFNDNYGDREYIVVGFDFEGTDGVQYCETIIEQGFPLVVSGANSDPVNRFCNVIKGSDCADSPASSNSEYQSSVQTIKDRINSRLSGYDSPTKELKRNSAQQLITLCYTVQNSKPTGTGNDSQWDDSGSGPDFEFKDASGTTKFAQYNRDLKQSEISWIYPGNIWASQNARLGRNGNIHLNFNKDASWDTNFFPLGTGYSEMAANNRENGIPNVASCKFLKDNKNLFFEGVSAEDIAAANRGGSDALNGDDSVTCASASGSSLGWLICPVITAGQEALEWMYLKALGPLLDFQLGTDGVDSLREVWSGFRVIANLIFVIAFFVVIYAAASGNVLSAYDVKKLLPRLFVVAILVQLSFVLSMLALEISNEIGRGVRSLILFPVQEQVTVYVGGITGNEITGGGDTSNLPGAVGEGIIGVFQDAGELILGTGLGIVMAVLLLILIVYSLIGMLMLAGAFIIRDVGIVVLIVVSPIAFSLAVLPGTESFFRSWWKWFFGLLSVYPIMVAFLSAGQLVAAIFSASDAFAPPIRFLVATTALFLPYFFAPKVLQFAGQATGAFKGFVEFFDKQKSRVGQSGAMKRTKDRGKLKAWDATAAAVNRKGGDGFVAKRFNKSKSIGKAYAGARSAVREQEDSDMKAQQVLQEGQIANVRSSAATAKVAELRRKGIDPTSDDGKKQIGEAVDRASIDHLTAIMDSKTSTDASKRAAATRLVTVHSNDAEAVRSVRENIERGMSSDDKASQDAASKMLQENIGALSKDAPHVYKGVGGALSSPTSAIMGFKTGTTADIAKVASSSAATGDTKNLDMLVSKYVEAAQNQSLRGMVSDKNVKIIMDEMSAAGIAIPTELTAQYNPDGTFK